MIDFVDVAIVDVRDVSGTVTFDRRLTDELEQHLLLDHVLPLVLARQGALVLHGAVISRSGRAAVLVGATGAGKSTLTAFAWQQGWTVGGDDGAVLYVTDPPTVEPTYATIRLDPAGADLLGITSHENDRVAGKIRLHSRGGPRFSMERTEVGAVVIIEPIEGSEQSRFEPLDSISAHARLFGATFHADLTPDRTLPGVLEGLAKLVETSTVGRLSVPRGRRGLTDAERVLRTVMGESADEPVWSEPS